MYVYSPVRFLLFIFLRAFNRFYFFFSIICGVLAAFLPKINLQLVYK